MVSDDAYDHRRENAVTAVSVIRRISGFVAYRVVLQTLRA